LKAVLYYFHEAHQKNDTRKKRSGSERLLSNRNRKGRKATVTKDEENRTINTDSFQLGTERIEL